MSQSVAVQPESQILARTRTRRTDVHPGSSVREDLSLLAPLRILANFSVVAHHMRGGDVFEVRFGMFLFLGMMFALAAGSRSAESKRAFIRRKSVSLLAPWLRWSLVYVALAIAVGAVREGGWDARLESWMLTAGGHASLWFLPFAFTMLLAWRLAQPLFMRISPTRVAVFGATAGLAALVYAAFRLERGTPPLPWDAWLRAAPIVLWGIALGQARRLEQDRRLIVLVAVPAMASLAWLADPWIGFHDDLGRRTAVVMILLALGLSWSPRLPRFVAWVGTLTYGIYLVHPLVAKVLPEFVDPFAWSEWTHGLLVWFLTAGLVLLLRRIGIRGAEIQRRLTTA